MNLSPTRILALLALCCAGAAQAAGAARVDALEGEAWVLRGANPVALGVGDALEAGDRVLTGARGRMRLELNSNASLLVDADSEIDLPGAAESDAATHDGAPTLQLRRGKACVNYRPRDDDQLLRFVVGGMLSAAMRHRGHFCAARREDVSAVSLREGSLQLTHAVDESLVVISEAGTEVRIDDYGELALLQPDGDEVLTQYDESPIEAAPAPDSGEAAGANGAAQPDAGAETAAAGAWRYTVYLFSTRSQTVAARVNQELRDAGLDTRIIVGNEDAVTRYRIARSGFGSRAEAEAFAESIRGRHGIESTWIGRQKLPAE